MISEMNTFLCFTLIFGLEYAIDRDKYSQVHNNGRKGEATLS